MYNQELPSLEGTENTSSVDTCIWETGQVSQIQASTLDVFSAPSQLSNNTSRNVFKIRTVIDSLSVLHVHVDGLFALCALEASSFLSLLRPGKFCSVDVAAGDLQLPSGY